MAAAFLAPYASSLSSSSAAFCPSVENARGPYVSSLVGSRGRYSGSCRRRRRPPHTRCCARADNVGGGKLERSSLEKELQKLEGTKLKWAEIDFPTIQDELDAIDEYVAEEGIEEGDCWPIFLRACAYESRGQSQLAIAQFSMVLSAAGLSMVPNLWERRAYNTFKVGDLGKADALYDVSIRILTEAIGNELHFAHWFDDTFSDFLPRHNGPSFAIQRAVAKYCTADLPAARSALIPALIVRDTGAEHAVLWLIASELKPESLPYGMRSDLRIIEEWRDSEPHDYPNSDTLRLCLDIFLARAQNPDTDVSSLVDKLKYVTANAIDVRDSTTALIYLALYYDAIDGDEASRDLYLDKIGQLPGSPSCTDSLDFVYHAARYRFGLTNAKS